MEQELNTKAQLTAWIAMPELITGGDLPVLRSFAEQYPYFQPLRLMLARAALESTAPAGDIAAAALYNNGQLLHRVLYNSDSLLSIKFNVISYDISGMTPNEPEPLDETGIDEVGTEEPATAEIGPGTEILAEEEKVYEEIGEVNIDDYRLDSTTRSFPVTGKTVEKKPDIVSEGQGYRQFEEQADELVMKNYVANDFFAFQDNFKVEDVPQIEEYSEQAALEQEEAVISKYDDDKLPYTFLWWLAKTRKEHEQIFQPYASPKKTKPVEPGRRSHQNPPGELQQQYVENIFHMQSVFGDEETTYTPAPRRNSKGDEIIESFIKNEPQISPPKAEQINNENKARKSAEDHSDLVSETLAKIYIEQMLYDKAIETYEKLSLMFPEKSRYFADLVQSIEKKI